MARDLTLSKIESDFILKSLASRLRFDNRKFSQHRSLTVSFTAAGDDYGVADVRLGNTRVIARISAEITQPYDDRPYEGLFLISTEISPMAAPSVDPSASSGSGNSTSISGKTEQELVISRVIEKSIRRAGALDTESLCIIAGEKCWAVRADVNFLDHDGGLVDAGTIAVIAGLLHFRRPEVTIEGIGSQRRVIAHPVTERVPVPLSVLHVPICTTVSFFDLTKAAAITIDANTDNNKGTNADQNGEDGNQNYAVLLDATLQEEQLRHGFMCVTANTNREICQIYKSGLLPVDATILLNCTETAITIAERFTTVIKNALKEDEQARNTGNSLVEARAENDRQMA
ncbi:ribosomal protein S5 domain 2-type protein [Lipomyces japonicus]|uniref:ribosomal protein S5 domain 2-type protein n=1 Tax=Lipomyces japonicus TaxID=56871 RepID=UPI0034CFE289